MILELYEKTGKQVAVLIDEYTKEWVEPQTFNKIDVTTLDSFALAVQTGYLTIAEVKRDLLGTSLRYDFPNKEVRLSWNKDHQATA